jgi:hypothetical protein
MERSEVVIIFTLIMEPIINQTGSASRIGTYQRTGENNVIGDINADWKAGLASLTKT